MSNRWDKPKDHRLTALNERDGVVTARFANGDEVSLPATDLLPDPSATVDWTTLRFDLADPFELAVNGADGPIEIPTYRIRLHTDPEFAADWDRKDRGEVSLPGPPIGLRVRALRLARQTTGKDLAERAGILPKSLSQIELGRHDPAASTLQRLLFALGCRWGDLDNPPVTAPTKRGRGRPPGAKNRRAA